MRISEMEQMLAEVKRQHGNIQVLCGQRPIGALAVLSPQPGSPEKIASFVLRDRRYKPRA